MFTDARVAAFIMMITMIMIHFYREIYRLVTLVWVAFYGDANCCCTIRAFVIYYIILYYCTRREMEDKKEQIRARKSTKIQKERKKGKKLVGLQTRTVGLRAAAERP